MDISQFPGRMTPEQRDKALKWLSEKAAQKEHGQLSCHVCGRFGWILSDWLVGPVTLDSSNFAALFGTVVYPHVQIHCQNCGNTMWFNAMMMGIQGVTEAPPPMPPPPNPHPISPPPQVQGGWPNA
jgi:hypothetical protein